LRVETRSDALIWTGGITEFIVIIISWPHATTITTFTGIV
jgi:hypothetical protein